MFLFISVYQIWLFWLPRCDRSNDFHTHRERSRTHLPVDACIRTLFVQAIDETLENLLYGERGPFPLCTRICFALETEIGFSRSVRVRIVRARNRISVRGGLVHPRVVVRARSASGLRTSRTPSRRDCLPYARLVRTHSSANYSKTTKTRAGTRLPRVRWTHTQVRDDIIIRSSFLHRCCFARETVHYV